MRRKEKLITGEIYHIFTKSIAGYKVFNTKKDYTRLRDLFLFYNISKPPFKFSRYQGLQNSGKGVKKKYIEGYHSKKKLTQMIAYCIMPTHIHLILKQLKDNGISVFMSNVLNSYSRYFNTKHNRSGPLWEKRFQNRLVKTEEELLHLTRYVHLNPVTAFLTERPQDWPHSSYNEYCGNDSQGRQSGICVFNNLLAIDFDDYPQFVNDQKSYQRELAKIKKLIVE